MSSRKNVWSKKRRKSLNIPIGKTVLFIYCGKCTEPLYFKAALNDIKESMDKAAKGITSFSFYDKVCDIDPLRITTKIPNIVDSFNKRFDEVYVVFDKDDYPDDNFDMAINKINKMSTNDCQYFPLWSNQCIELWFLLHFEYLQANINRKDYINKLNIYLPQKYKKNMEGLYLILKRDKNSINHAIERAQKLLSSHESVLCSKKNPATNVFVFFEKYKEYLN